MHTNLGSHKALGKDAIEHCCVTQFYYVSHDCKTYLYLLVYLLHLMFECPVFSTLCDSSRLSDSLTIFVFYFVK